VMLVEFSHRHRIVEARIVHCDGDLPIRLRCGSEKVQKVMYDGEGQPLPKTRFSRFAHRLPRRPGVDDARRYSVGFIEACCSQEARDLDPKIWAGVGGHIHAAQVTFQAGFEWVVPPARFVDQGPQAIESLA
jgi:hypothetical protein